MPGDSAGSEKSTVAGSKPITSSELKPRRSQRSLILWRFGLVRNWAVFDVYQALAPALVHLGRRALLLFDRAELLEQG